MIECATFNLWLQNNFVALRCFEHRRLASGGTMHSGHLSRPLRRKFVTIQNSATAKATHA